jgi:glycosyltransferase involved in cell wall biosynthesis
MRIALVHDWFKANGGAEKVAGSIISLYKSEQLSVYALFNKFSRGAKLEILQGFNVSTSLLQKMPFIAKTYRYMLPIMPCLIHSFRLKNFDIIITTSHAVAKSVGADPSILNICYCHSPMRYAWDMYDDYISQHKIGKLHLYRWLIQAIRNWDFNTASRVHYFIANSEHIRQRIKKSYNRDATVIYPPVRVDRFELYDGERESYYLCIGRLVPYKKIDLIVAAFAQMPNQKLVLIGEGYGSKQFQRTLDNAPNITWLGYQQDEQMIHCIQRAKACIFAAKEDFGIACVEVQACGTPVVALNYGGYKETVIDNQTGYLFDNQTEKSIIEAIEKMEATPLTNRQAIRQNALKFSEQRFHNELSNFVAACYKEFYNRPYADKKNS